MPQDFIGPVKKSGYRPPKRRKTFGDLTTKMDHRTKTRLTYFYIPLIYILVSIFLLSALGFAITSPFSETINKLVGEAEPSFEPSLSSIYKGSDVSNGILTLTQVNTPLQNRQFAVLYSKKLNINTPVYCGVSDLVLANGVGFNPNSAMPGANSFTYLSGNCNYLAGLKNAAEGDVLSITTNYGYFKYKITKAEIIPVEEADKIDVTQGNETLVLQSGHPFDELSDARYNVLRVYASKTSGPSVAY